MLKRSCLLPGYDYRLGGVQKGQKVDYVIHGQSLKVIHYSAKLQIFKSESESSLKLFPIFRYVQWYTGYSAFILAIPSALRYVTEGGLIKSIYDMLNHSKVHTLNTLRFYKKYRMLYLSRWMFK